jgi:hypothetical protein
MVLGSLADKRVERPRESDSTPFGQEKEATEGTFLGEIKYNQGAESQWSGRAGIRVGTVVNDRNIPCTSTRMLAHLG